MPREDTPLALRLKLWSRWSTHPSTQQSCKLFEKVYTSTLNDYFDEKAECDEYVVATLAGRVYKLEELPGGAKISTVLLSLIDIPRICVLKEKELSLRKP